ncbi:hypothetical protein ILUMI_09914 [Ignelater luminosus]|uniref:Reverse transcriptase domain-containing protein n=1 Tax=Ignelater luminosus TaxID=2038154 RepID=A0A8K0CZ42_IGNLU|nr:hypothetical protein ILUMI_09914 [Ignelater luminosus]
MQERNEDEEEMHPSDLEEIRSVKESEKKNRSGGSDTIVAETIKYGGKMLDQERVQARESQTLLWRAGLMFHRRHQCLAYADGIALITRSQSELKEVTIRPVKASQKMSLEINHEKTKYTA